jgi:SAM-dependent methyltransferase
MDWDKRSDVAELMDDPNRMPEELRSALRMLRRLNSVSLARRIIAGHVRPGRVLDVATGSADILQYLKRRGLATQAIGLDVSGKILGLAREFAPDVTLVQADARRLPFRDKAFDTAICHLFFHHCDRPMAIDVVREMNRVARTIVVLDLLRRRRLYYWVRAATWFCPSPLARHDGPASVRRSFSLDEVRDWLAESGVAAKLETHLFHRWCIRT